MRRTGREEQRFRAEAHFGRSRVPCRNSQNLEEIEVSLTETESDALQNLAETRGWRSLEDLILEAIRTWLVAQTGLESPEPVRMRRSECCRWSEDHDHFWDGRWPTARVEDLAEQTTPLSRRRMLRCSAKDSSVRSQEWEARCGNSTETLSFISIQRRSGD